MKAPPEEVYLETVPSLPQRLESELSIHNLDINDILCLRQLAKESSLLEKQCVPMPDYDGKCSTSAAKKSWNMKNNVNESSIIV